MEGVEYSVKCRLTEKGNWEVIGDEIRFEPTNVKKKFISGNTNLSDRRLSRQVVNDLRESFTMITDDDYESYSETIISSSNKKITTKYSYDEISGTSVYKR